jgi:hypothetical protein
LFIAISYNNLLSCGAGPIFLMEVATTTVLIPLYNINNKTTIN